MFENIRIVLVGTTHPGNIGATARAMRNMGLSSLSLVAPKTFPCAEATARASGADAILERAAVHPDLPAAVADCRLVVGSSARRRTVDWPQLGPREAAARLVQEAAAGPVALVFGRESSGLSNAELDRCAILTQVPTNPEFSSLNLAAAVQLYAYELRLAALEGAADPQPPRELAAAGELEGFHEHLTQTLFDLQFADPQRSDKLLRRLRRLFHRAELDREEVNILRGVLTAAQRAARRD